jgi:hypothetical protein
VRTAPPSEEAGTGTIEEELNVSRGSLLGVGGIAAPDLLIGLFDCDIWLVRPS